MDHFIIALVLFLLASFGSRVIFEKSFKKLDNDQKAELFDLFSKDRIWSFGISIGLVILFYLSLRFEIMDPFVTYVLYMSLLLGYIVFMAFYAHKKLKANAYPDFFIQSYILSTSLRLAGFVIFVAILGSKY